MEYSIAALPDLSLFSAESVYSTMHWNMHTICQDYIGFEMSSSDPPSVEKVNTYFLLTKYVLPLL